jgi:hypothetical protein
MKITKKIETIVKIQLNPIFNDLISKLYAIAYNDMGLQYKARWQWQTNRNRFRKLEFNISLVADEIRIQSTNKMLTQNENNKTVSR